MPPTLQRQLLWYSLIGIILLAPFYFNFYRPAGGLLDIIGYSIGRDFINVWTAPQIVDRFSVMTLSDLTGYHRAQSEVFGVPMRFHNWSYPIDMLFFAYPFSWLPYLAALLLWTVLGFALYLVVAVTRLPEDHRLLAFVFLLVAPATMVNIFVGQNGFFTAALVLGAIALLDRRPWIAGVLVGLLTMKPHLGILVGVVLVATFAWRSIIAAAATTMLLVGASIVMWGTDPWAAYLTKGSAFAYLILTKSDGFQNYMMMSVLSSALVSGIPLKVAEVMQVIGSIGAIVATALAFRSTKDVGLRALLVTSGTFLVGHGQPPSQRTRGARLWSCLDPAGGVVGAARLEAWLVTVHPWCGVCGGVANDLARACGCRDRTRDSAGIAGGLIRDARQGAVSSWLRSA
jgi:hypothetical protein